MNFDIAKHGTSRPLGRWVQKWLIPRHPVCGANPVEIDGLECRTIRDVNDPSQNQWLVDSMDAILFVEQPYMRSWGFLAQYRRNGGKVICIPMHEWFHHDLLWLDEVDAIVAVNRTCLNWANEVAATRMRKTPWKDRIWHLQWGVDCAKFRPRQIEKANTFLFCNGYGGVHGRKGLEAVVEVAKACPEVQFILRTQKRVDVNLQNVEMIVGGCADNRDLYSRGDVLLAPSKFEGLGLHTLEAAACGMPAIVTNGGPMNEGPCAWLVDAKPSKTRIGLRDLDQWSVDIPAFVELVRSIHGTDISHHSKDVREAAETWTVQHAINEIGLAIGSMVAGAS